MHAIPRHIAAAAAAARPSSSALVAPSFVCPSCASSIATTSPSPRSPSKQHRQTSAAAASRKFSTSQRRRHAAAAAAAAASPPSSGYARLNSRRLISIAGVDAAKFLHGIVTSSTLDRAEGFYTGVLNATGRVLHDVFIYPDTMRLGAAAAAATEAIGDAFLIEVDAGQADTLLRHLKRYRLRSKFKLAPVGADECGVWQVWDDGVEHQAPTRSLGGGGGGGGSSNTSSPTTRIVLEDTRAPGLGHRLLTTVPETQLAPELEALGFARGGGVGDGEDEVAYKIRRYLRGVPEGQDEIPREAALPLESNMDIMGGIDFRKGCYVGQELTIRTKHRGVVRKRVLPCVLYTDAAPDKLEYKPGGGVAAETLPAGGLSIARDTSGSGSGGPGVARPRSAGTFLRGVGNVGLALCRLQVMTDIELPGEAAAGGGGGGGGALVDPAANEFVLKMMDKEQDAGGAADRVKIKAFVPPWLRQRLDEANASKH
ncbi:transferase CAF17 [Microdochium nivale]|nr:transferase CAF17 [Microdochium nivale]